MQEKNKQEKEAATKIQAAYRGYNARKKNKEGTYMELAHNIANNITDGVEDYNDGNYLEIISNEESAEPNVKPEAKPKAFEAELEKMAELEKKLQEANQKIMKEFLSKIDKLLAGFPEDLKALITQIIKIVTNNSTDIGELKELLGKPRCHSLEILQKLKNLEAKELNTKDFPEIIDKIKELKGLIESKKEGVSPENLKQLSAEMQAVTLGLKNIQDQYKAIISQLKENNALLEAQKQQQPPPPQPSNQPVNAELKAKIEEMSRQVIALQKAIEELKRPISENLKDKITIINQMSEPKNDEQLERVITTLGELVDKLTENPAPIPQPVNFWNDFPDKMKDFISNLVNTLKDKPTPDNTNKIEKLKTQLEGIKALPGEF